MRSKWRLFLFIGLILSLASSTIGCAPSDIEEDLGTARAKAYADGRIAGKAEGLEIGYDKGYDIGLAELQSAKQEAEKVCYDNGYETGLTKFESAKKEAVKLNYDWGFRLGFEEGEAKGYEEGYQEGEARGYDEGYGTGYDKGYETGLTGYEDRIALPIPEPLPSTPPSGATAICNDGTYSYSQSRRGTCSWHGGVRTWLR